MGLDINPQIYYDGAKKLTDIGDGIDTATTKLVKALFDGTGSMAGSSDAAKKWAASYDSRTGDTVDTTRKLAETLKYYASLVALAGYNHAMANYQADKNPNKGAAPTKPASVPPPVPACYASAPASGGPGNGLVSGVAGLMEKIHVHIPDGDTDKLGKAGKAWHEFLAAEAISRAESEISGVSTTLSQIQSPEIGDLNGHLGTMRTSARKIYDSANALATECDRHKKALDDLREKLKKILHTLEEAIAVSLVVTIFADVITAGVGVLADAVTVAAWARYVDIAATDITAAVEVADIDGALVGMARTEDVLARSGGELDEIGALTREDIEAGLEESTPAADSAAPGGIKPSPQQAEQIIQEADRTGSGLKNDAWHRSASFPVDEIGAKGTVYEITGGDGVTRTLVQMPGEVNGVPGRFEWIIDGNKVTHQMFVRNGTINGVPIKQ